MTLSELATFICNTVNQTEAADVAACKGYLTQRQKMIWQDQLWKDSLVEYEKTVTSQDYDPTTSTWLPTRQILLIEPLIAQVVAVRSRDWKFGVQSSEFYYRRDFDSFQNATTATEYRLLSPCVWDFDTAQSASLVITSAGDEQSEMGGRVIEDDNITESSFDFTMTSTPSSLGSIYTVQTLSKKVGNTPVYMVLSSDAGISFTNSFSQGVNAFVAVNPTPSQYPTGYTQVGYGETVTIAAVLGDTVDVVTGAHDANTTVPAPGFGITLTVNGDGDLVWSSASLTDAILSVGADDTVATLRQRLQIIGSIADDTILRILGKRTCPDFSADSDTAAITGSENCLIEFGLADMYRRARQVGKAEATAGNAGILLAQLIKEQTAQQAHKKRLIPSGGFGEASYPFNSFDSLF